MARGVFLAASALATLAAALVVDPAGKPEVHPVLTTQKCTKSGGCVTQQTKVVLDQNFHNVHAISGSGSCANGASSVCPDKATCAKNCAVEGADYAGNGVTTSGSSVKLDMFVNKGGVNTAVSPRIYLLDAKGAQYEMIKLTNQEFTFDVDNSKLPCGMNGALYLSEMAPNGGQGEYNKAGAPYGTGYCDAQCFVTPWFNGEVSLGTKGAKGGMGY
jgi:cellulase